jgi:hypothetical protein
MSLYVKKFVEKEFSHLLDNDKMNDLVDLDDENETLLIDYLLINYFFLPPSFLFQIDCACAGCLLQKAGAQFVGVCYFCDELFQSPAICDFRTSIRA